MFIRKIHAVYRVCKYIHQSVRQLVNRGIVYDSSSPRTRTGSSSFNTCSSHLISIKTCGCTFSSSFSVTVFYFFLSSSFFCFRPVFCFLYYYFLRYYAQVVCVWVRFSMNFLHNSKKWVKEIETPGDRHGPT